MADYLLKESFPVQFQRLAMGALPRPLAPPLTVLPDISPRKNGARGPGFTAFANLDRWRFAKKLRQAVLAPSFTGRDVRQDSEGRRERSKQTAVGTTRTFVSRPTGNIDLHRPGHSSAKPGHLFTPADETDFHESHMKLAWDSYEAPKGRRILAASAGVGFSVVSADVPSGGIRTSYAQAAWLGGFRGFDAQ
ncbi:hypothetical protein ACSBOB_30675 [Mesorhizobium sp. ASY16-5R]|uniref:hypothetical protein n=1 Tax=Mesorhizobium sp. ASY16-5R TaxID=3445772 RepID=UPI003F9FD2D2